MRLLLAIACILLLAGCADLETGYAVSDASRGSVNGCSALLARLSARTRLHRAWQLTPRLEHDTDLLIHLARAPGLPGDEACTWLTRWLEDEDDRTAVIILRDGNLAPFLCQRWASEARTEAGRNDGALAEALNLLAERLEDRAEREQEPAWSPGRSTCPLFSVEAASRRLPNSVDGLSPAPAAMTVGVTPLATDATTVVSAVMPDGSRAPFAVRFPVGGSHLLVIANATPLLDGALADPQARRLAGRLIDAMLSGNRQRAAWVQELRVREAEPTPSNPMLKLFTRQPFAWMSWHATALVLLALWAAAAWLGRREEPRDARPQRFGAHVDALAGHLRDGRHHAWCARTIARLRGLPTPPAETRSESGARRWLAEQCTRSERKQR